MEFTCARIAGTIVNLADPEVQRVLHSRAWPQTIDDYFQMMAEEQISFTTPGDRAYVNFVFTKMCRDLRFAAHEEAEDATTVCPLQSPKHSWRLSRHNSRRDGTAI